MMASGHQAMGLTWGVAAITFSHLLPIEINGKNETILFIIIVMIGALLPDMDSKSSKLGRYAYPIAISVMILVGILYIWQPKQFWTLIDEELTFVLATMVPVFFVLSSHRTWTHSIVFLGLVVMYLSLVGSWMMIPDYLQYGLMIGIGSHIFGDFLTRRGVPLLYPFSKRNFRFLFSFRTGSAAERFVVIGLIVINIWLLIEVGITIVN
ncbi:metal-dependent hydrolase [Alkalibacillus silvisoli]|uniref:Metal-dependent hydrolase n=1 Tax=Alkalibacillus silvisoli TaxID=392823 RepID=A0ABN1A2L2_9BACI